MTGAPPSSTAAGLRIGTALLDGAKEVRPDASVDTGRSGTAGFRF
jgi:hypothetical protein